MSAQEWEQKRDRIRIVNDWDDTEALADELAWSMIPRTDNDEAEERLHEEARQQLLSLFQGRTPRAGFAEAQPSLPEKDRFELVARSEDPAGDIYLEPDCHDPEF